MVMIRAGNPCGLSDPKNKRVIYGRLHEYLKAFANTDTDLELYGLAQISVDFMF